MINNLLAKHFAGECSPEEEGLVQKYRTENESEYDTLKSLWQAEHINKHEFDTAKAWEKVAASAKPAKRRKLYQRWSVAATIVLLIFAGSYYAWNNTSASNAIIVEQKAEESNETVKLSDGSIVFLNKGAHIKYPKEFSTNERSLTLTGEAFFEIAKDAKRPFRIKTEHAEVEVLGTSFNINTAEEETTVAVATGKVKVSSLFEEKSAVLTPNESAQITATDLNHFATKDMNFLAWKTGNFVFKEMTVDAVVTDLNRFYEDKIILKNQTSDCLLTVNFSNNELAGVLEIIQLTCNLKINKKDGNYELL